MPLPLAMMIIASSMLLLTLRRQRLALGLLIFALVWLYAFSILPVARALGQPLEFAYPKYAGQPVEYVVVLGSGHSSDDRAPLLGQPTKTALARLLQGLDVLEQNPNATLLLSGYEGHDHRTHAEVMAETAVYLGVSPLNIKLAPQARDTAGEAEAWAPILNERAFALVTSAVHIPRAMYLFQSQGLNPIAAPANFEAAGHDAAHWRSWLPQAHVLANAEAAWHEYLGLTWARLASLFS